VLAEPKLGTPVFSFLHRAASAPTWNPSGGERISSDSGAGGEDGGVNWMIAIIITGSYCS